MADIKAAGQQPAYNSSDDEVNKHDCVKTTEHGLADPDAELDDRQKRIAERKLMRKLDFRLIPWVC